MEVAAGGAFLFVTEPERDHGGADVGLQERHRGGVPQDVGGDSFAAQRWAAVGGGAGVLVDQPFDGVAAEPPAAVRGEQRVLGLAVALFEPDGERLDGLGGERHGALLAVLPDAVEVGDVGAEADVLAAQTGQLGDAQPGLDRGQQQRVVAPAGPGCAVGRGEQRVDLLLVR